MSQILSHCIANPPLHNSKLEYLQVCFIIKLYFIVKLSTLNQTMPVSLAHSLEIKCVFLLFFGKPGGNFRKNRFQFLMVGWSSHFSWVDRRLYPE